MPDFADLLLDAVFMVDVLGRIVYVSAACERIFGYTPGEMIGRELFDFLAPEDRATTRDEAKQVMAGYPRIGFENRYVRKDGRRASIMWSARWSEADQLRIGVARDVTKRKHAEAMQAATYAISEAAHTAGDLVALFREIHRIIAELLPVAGFTIAMCDAHTGRLAFPYPLDDQADAPAEQEAIASRMCTDVIGSGQSKLLHHRSPAALSDASASSGGSASWLAVPLFSQQGAMGALIVKSRAGTFYTEQDQELLQFVSTQVATAIERKQLHAELLRMAQYDALTGLPNRRLFHDRMEIALARNRREQKRVAVLYVDLDDFKRVNDLLGHAAGDLLLQEVSRRLTQCVREEDTVARLGGDEFVVLLEHVPLPGDAAIVAEKIRSAVSQQASIDGQQLRMLPSIGIAFHPDHGDDAEQLLKHADKAMYSAKTVKVRGSE
ncbi:sensor domain-containing protein [Noviherbaspirillum cavernae]|nr:diguanylate cyclase [Noviherbaspirillum cavernae]